MLRRFRRPVLVLTVVGLLVVAAVASAPGASAYGKANWQTTLVGTFNIPATGTSEGFWGWCDFAGGVASGDSADCQIAEYFHSPAGSGWTCQLSIDANNWYQSNTGNGFDFHVSGSAVVHPSNLTDADKAACVNFFTNEGGSTTFADVDTFIPAFPGHYNLGFLVPIIFPGAVGAFNFTVKQIP
jgi:hypothetical protein